MNPANCAVQVSRSRRAPSPRFVHSGLLPAFLFGSAALLTSCGSSYLRTLPPLPPGAKPIFTEVTRTSGVDFHFRTDEVSAKVIATMGGGVALADFDGDGDLDLYLVNSVPTMSTANRDSCSKLYRNDGRGHFEDVTKQAGVEYCGWGNGVFWIDIDSDGRDDLFLTGTEENHIFHNETDRGGPPKFRDVTNELGLANGLFCVGMNILDYDGDGLPDLYIANYLKTTPLDEKNVPSGDLKVPEDYAPLPNVLWHNLGDGPDGLPRYEDVTAATGSANAEGKSLAVAVLDWNGDGRPDIFVANDRTPNAMLTNLGPDATGLWKFANQAVELGVAYDAFGKHPSGMGVTVGDPDRDGHPDLFVTNFANEWNDLYHNIDGVTFEAATERTGLGPPSYPKIGWGTLFFDYDNDGWEDLAVLNGGLVREIYLFFAKLVAPKAKADMYSVGEDFHQHSLLFHNTGDLRFDDVTNVSGDWGRPLMVARGLAAGDLDGDGALDLVVGDQDGPARIFHNDALAEASWIEIQLKPGRDRKTVYGAVVTVIADGRVDARDWYIQPSYASGSAVPLHFGLGRNEKVDRVEISWPGGQKSIFENLPVRKRWIVTRGTAEPVDAATLAGSGAFPLPAQREFRKPS